MKTKSKWKRCVCLVLLVALLSTTAYAISAEPISFNRTGEKDCDFGPDTGVVFAVFNADTGCVSTQVNFGYSESDAAAIAEYNNESTPKYAGIGVTNDPTTGGSEAMDAYYVLTNLPDPKSEVENDLFSQNSFHEESEAVALGVIHANQEYFIQTCWYDYRDGTSSSEGRWCVNAELSKNLLGEYIVKEWASIVAMPYGTNFGEV